MRLYRLQKNAYSDLQGLKPLKKTQTYVVPKGTNHKTYDFFHNLTTSHLISKLCGSRLQPRHQNTKQNWALAPES